MDATGGAAQNADSGVLAPLVRDGKGQPVGTDYQSMVTAERPENSPLMHQKADQESKALGLTTPETTKTLQTLVHRGIFWGGHVLLVLFLLVLASRVLHMILPDQWHWLNGTNLKEIDQIILGLVAGLGARFFPNGNGGKKDE